MDHYKLILPEHLNHYGHLFGGNMLKWIDEFSYITANQEFPGNNFVTIALDDVVFRETVRLGEIVRFSVIREHLGKTSVRYSIQAFGTRQNTHADDILFETIITFVAVDKEGKKVEIRKGQSSLQ